MDIPAPLCLWARVHKSADAAIFFPPGESLETVLTFDRDHADNEPPDDDPITFTTKVLATPGEK